MLKRRRGVNHYGKSIVKGEHVAMIRNQCTMYEDVEILLICKYYLPVWPIESHFLLREDNTTLYLLMR